MTREVLETSSFVGTFKSAKPARALGSEGDYPIAIIEHKETLDKLNSYKERVSKFLSEEDQKAMLLKEMEEFLG